MFLEWLSMMVESYSAQGESLKNLLKKKREQNCFSQFQLLRREYSKKNYAPIDPLALLIHPYVRHRQTEWVTQFGLGSGRASVKQIELQESVEEKMGPSSLLFPLSFSAETLRLSPLHPQDHRAEHFFGFKPRTGAFCETIELIGHYASLDQEMKDLLVKEYPLPPLPIVSLATIDAALDLIEGMERERNQVRKAVETTYQELKSSGIELSKGPFWLATKRYPGLEDLCRERCIQYQRKEKELFFHFRVDQTEEEHHLLLLTLQESRRQEAIAI